MAEINNMGEQIDLFKLFVGQIPKDMDELSLRPYFEEFGPIVEISVIRDNITMMSKGCAFVTYSYEHSAQMAVDKLHDKVQLPNSMNPLQVRFAETQVDRDNKLFIGMLPKTMGEQDLHDMFSIYGELREVHVIRGPEGGAKGCAFVKFIERDAAIAAIDNLNDTVPMGATRPLVVKFADGKKSGAKEDPWGHQLPMYRGQGPMGGPMHMGGQQQRMMYQYPSMGHGAPGMQHGAPPAQGYHSQMGGGLGQQQRYGGYPSQPTGGAPGAGPYYGVGAELGPDAKRGYGQEPLLGKAPGAEGEFGAPARGDGAYESGLEILPPQGGSSGALPPPPQQQPPQHSPYPMDSESSHVRPPEGPSGANLFIYHLPRDLTDADLATLFAPFGNVISAKVFVDKKTSDSKGFGFVSYDTLENANSAIESMNGFQIGSKRLKVQHKRVLGGPHTPGMPQHSMYGGGGMSHHHGGPPMHMGHHQQQHSPYAQPPMHQQQSSYGYRPAAPSHGMMMSPPSMLQQQQQPYGSAPGMGLMSGGMSTGGYQQMQMRGGVPSQMGGMPQGGPRMQQQPPQAAPMRGAYNYPSYGAPAPSYAPAGQQQQRPPGVMVNPRGPQQEMMFGAPSASLQQPPSPYAAPDPQQQQHANQSSLSAISYMDGAGGGSKAPQPQGNGAGGYYGQY